MGKKAAAVICGTASFLGLLAAILGFVGEGTKSQVRVRMIISFASSSMQ